MSSSFRTSGLLPFLLIAWGLWLGAIVGGEQVPANDGLGWDGVRFARYATRGPEALLKREINSYYVQRMGPSLAVHGIIRAAGQPFDPATIRWAFLGMNLILLTGSIVMIVDMGRRLALSTHAQWLLFIGLFVNPENGRLPVYYANIGDSTAFTLGVSLLWGWCARKPWVLVVTSLIALVSWPAAFYLLLPLIVWPRAEDAAEGARDRPFGSTLGWKWGMLALPLGVLLMAASWRMAGMSYVAWSPWITASLGVNAWLFGLAVVAALAQLDIEVIRGLRNGGSPKTLATAIALFLASRAYVAAAASGSLAFSEVTYWREVLLYVQMWPLAPAVGHAAYFGALAALSYVLWPRALAVARWLGPGPFAALALMGMQALDTESRRLNANWPLVALCTVIALEPWLRDRRVMAAMTVTCVLFSKLWWRWSGADLFAEAHDPGNYYNLQGPSLSDEAYAVHLIAAALFATAVWLMVGRPPSRSPEVAPVLQPT